MVLAAVLSGFAIAGCGNSGNPEPAATSGAGAASATTPDAVREFKLEGEVISVDKDKKSAVIKNKDIEGFMSAMTMAYPVPEQVDLEKMKPGDHIQATVYQNPSESRFWVGKVEIQK